MKHIKTQKQLDEDKKLNLSGVMNSKIKINENVDENIKVIEDSYNDYISVENKYKDVMAKQIALTAKGFIKNRGGKLEDWLKVFAGEDIVISKLKEL